MVLVVKSCFDEVIVAEIVFWGINLWQKDPDYVPMSEDSNLGMDEDSTDVPPTSEDEEEKQLQPSDISSTDKHAEA